MTRHLPGRIVKQIVDGLLPVARRRSMKAPDRSYKSASCSAPLRRSRMRRCRQVQERIICSRRNGCQNESWSRSMMFPWYRFENDLRKCLSSSRKGACNSELGRCSSCLRFWHRSLRYLVLFSRSAFPSAFWSSQHSRVSPVFPLLARVPHMFGVAESDQTAFKSNPASKTDITCTTAVCGNTWKWVVYV